MGRSSTKTRWRDETCARVSATTACPISASASQPVIVWYCSALLSVMIDGAVTTGVTVADALFVAWPPAHAIVGNPPFQAKNKMQAELGAGYVRALRARYPQVPGMADYCVYWFCRAHEALPPGGRAGLVGTNTIRQNASRAGGLAPIVASGTIVEAVASRVWSGGAAVHVSIVSWIKQVGVTGPKTLSWQTGDLADSPWRQVELAHIGASLSPEVEVGAAEVPGHLGEPRRCRPRAPRSRSS